MIGTQVGSYKILEKLGEGGMGVVYKAVDTSLDRVVAMKALSAELANNPDLEKRFRAEAKAQANLNHTNIATLYAFLVEAGTAWMVMEFIEGESLADMLTRRGVIPWPEAVPLFKQALLGIGYAHRMGIVHRDIKPSNIMVNRAGMVKVMDFGIAKVLGNRGMTRTGTQIGTAYYMSPEQVINKGVDIRSDVYSLGITLYELLTANVPFTGDTDFEVMQAHMQTPPPLPTRFYPYIPKGVENAVLQAIEKSQAARFQTVEEFGAALEHPDTYQAPVASPAAAGPALAGGTRLEAPTQTIGPQPVYTNAGLTMTMQPAGTPAPGPVTPTPPAAAAPSFLASRNGKLILAGGGALVLLAMAGYALRPKPQPTPMSAVVGQAGSVAAPAPAATPAQVEIPAAAPGAPVNPPAQDKKKTQASVSTAPAPPQPAPPQTAQTPPQAAPQSAPPSPPPQPPVQPAAQPAAQQAAPPAAPPPSAAPATPAATAAAGAPVTIPVGTRITVRTLTLASTRSSKEGQQLLAIVDSPVVVGGRTAIARGASVSLRVGSMDEGIVLNLASVTVGGRQYQASAGAYNAPFPKDKKGNKVLRGLKHLDPVHRGGEQSEVMVGPDTRITYTLARPLEVIAP